MRTDPRPLPPDVAEYFRRFAYTIPIEDQEISLQALLDLVAICRPTVRPSWLSLLESCCTVQRRLSAELWAEVPVAIAALLTDLQLTPMHADLSALVDTAIDGAKLHGGQMGFARLAIAIVAMVD